MNYIAYVGLWLFRLVRRYRRLDSVSSASG